MRARGDASDLQIHTKYVPDLAALGALTRHDVARAVDRSRARLGVDVLDLVQFHWWDYDRPGMLDTAAWLHARQRAGDIRHLGLTNCNTAAVAAIVGAGVPVVSHQVQYSLLDQRPAGRDDAPLRRSRHRPAVLRRARRRLLVRPLPGRAGARRPWPTGRS